MPEDLTGTACYLLSDDAAMVCGQVLIVDASSLFKRGRNQNTLEDKHRKRIKAAYATFADEKHFAHVASLAEIEANDFDLNISRYVEPVDEDLPGPIRRAITDYDYLKARVVERE